jgi:hypothetical protein
MESLTELLVKLLTAETIDQSVALSLTIFVDMMQAERVCLLIWDTELDRYIVGDTWIKLPPNNRRDGADFRRFALRSAREAKQIHP